MNKPTISYLVNSISSLDNHIPIFVDVFFHNGRSFVLFFIKQRLIFLESKINKHEERFSYKCLPREELKRQFGYKKSRWRKDGEKHCFIDFQETILSYTVDRCTKSVFILTENDLCWWISLTIVIERLSTFCFDATGNNDIFMDLLNPLSVKSQTDDLCVNVSDIKHKIFNKSTCKQIVVAGEYMCLFSNNLKQLSIHLLQFEYVTTTPNIKNEVVYALPLQADIDLNYKLSTITSHPDVKADILVCRDIYEKLFNANKTILENKVGIVFASRGNVFATSLDCRCSENLKLICSLKQPVTYLSCLSLNDVQNIDSTVTSYESDFKSESAKRISAFKETMLPNNCFVVAGYLGKVLFYFSKFVSYQVISPVVACSSKNDLLVVSNGEVVNIYRINIKVNFVHQIENLKKKLEDALFFPDINCVCSTPIVDVQSLCWSSLASTLFCANSSLKLMKVTYPIDCFVENQILYQDLHCTVEEAFKKLDSINSDMDNLKIESKKLSDSLHDVKFATMIYQQHKNKLEDQKTSCTEVDANSTDVFVKYKKVYSQGQKRLLVMCVLKNDTNIPYRSHNWNLTVQCFTESRAYSDSVRCHMENIALPFVSPGGIFEFCFMLNNDLLKYNPVKLDFYLTFIFKGLLKEPDAASFFLISKEVSIVDMCDVIIGIPAIFYNQNEEKPQSKAAALYEKQTTGNIANFLYLKDKSFHFLISICKRQIEFINQKHQTKNIRKNCTEFESSCHIFYSYLLSSLNNGEDSIYYGALVTLAHINNEHVDLMMEEVSGNDKVYQLHMNSASLTLNVAFHSYTCKKLLVYNSHNLYNKEICESKLETAKAMLGRCEILENELTHIDINNQMRHAIFQRIVKLYTDLRKIS